MPKQPPKELPLESIVSLSCSEEDGPLQITHRRRGFLHDVHVNDLKKKRWPKRFKLNGKEPLTALSNRLRAQLDAAELPTDKWPVSPVESDRLHGYSPEEDGTVADEDIWIELVQDSTEPLTKLRIAADLLHAINCLTKQFGEEQLSDIFRAMTLYHRHYVMEDVHEQALAGAASTKGREQGPAAKKQKASVLRALILTIAEDFWTRHPALARQPVNTAKKIVGTVNEAIISRNLSRKPIAQKTIADHLRMALKETKEL